MIARKLSSLLNVPPAIQTSIKTVTDLFHYVQALTRAIQADRRELGDRIENRFQEGSEFPAAKGYGNLFWQNESESLHVDNGAWTEICPRVKGHAAGGTEYALIHTFDNSHNQRVFVRLCGGDTGGGRMYKKEVIAECLTGSFAYRWFFGGNRTQINCFVQVFNNGGVHSVYLVATLGGLQAGFMQAEAWLSDFTDDEHKVVEIGDFSTSTPSGSTVLNTAARTTYPALLEVTDGGIAHLGTTVYGTP